MVKTKIAFTFILALASIILITTSANAQTPSTFTYRGNLILNNAAVNGPCDFDFGLFDTLGNPLVSLVSAHTGSACLNN